VRSGGPGADRERAGPVRHGALFRATVTDGRLIALLLGYVAVTIWLILAPSSSVQTTVWWAVQFPGDGLFFLSARYIAVHPAIDQHARRFWRLTTIAAACFMSGDLLRALEGLAGIEHYAAGTVQTTLFALGQTCFVYALARYPALAGIAKGRFLLDATIVLFGSTALIWFLLTSPRATAESTGSVVSGLLVGAEVLLVSFLAIKLTLSGKGPATRTASAMMIAAALVQVVFSALLPLYTAPPKYGVALSIQLVSTALIALGPRLQVLQLKIYGEVGQTKRRRPYSLMPYFAVGVVYVLLLAALAGNGMLNLRSWGMVIAVGLVTGLVVWRQLLSTTENARLIAKLDNSVMDLHNEKERFRSLVAHSSDVTIVVDRENLITYASPAAERVLGLLPARLVGSRFTDHMHPDDVERLRPEWAAMSAVPGAATTTQGRLKSADNGWRWFEVVNTNLLNDPAIGGIVLNGRDVTDARELQERLQYQASHDVLTKLANRRLFGSRLTTAAREGGGEVALLMIDLDGFKPINDTHGHQVGDAVLVAVAERIRRCVRPTDTAARLGGDEFAVLIPGGSLDQAYRLAERFQAALAEPVTIGSLRLAIGASVGITVGDATRPEALIRQADAEMYAIKRRTARNRDPIGDLTSVGPESTGS
jgi:diguanylate cyclase (GGDEF)-like protein/PAS domain S-box-containing protein